MLLLARTPALAAALARALAARGGDAAKRVEASAPLLWSRATLGLTETPPQLDEETYARLVDEALHRERRRRAACCAGRCASSPARSPR